MSIQSKIKALFALITFVVAMCLMPLALAADKEAVGKVITVKGNVTAVYEGKTRALKRGSEVYVGEVVSSQKGATANLRYLDGTMLTLKAKTSLVIKEYSYDQKNKKNIILFELVKGGLKSVTGKINKGDPDAYTIKTPVATIGIRGTIFTVSYNPITESTSGVVFDGKIEITSKSGKSQLITGQDKNKAFLTNGGGIKTMSMKQLQENTPCS